MKIITQRQIELSNQIIEFLRTHPAINISQIEKDVGITPKALMKARKHPEKYRVSDKYMFELIRELGRYGLEIDGYRILSDDDPEIFLIKEFGEVEEVEVTEKGRIVFHYIQKQYRSVAGDLLDLF